MSTPVIQEIFGLLSRYGVRHVVCSPGSRNAALLTEADACVELHKHVVVDERSAAFIAAGIAMTSHSPVALVCTSGSALLNYAPAVAECYYQGLPLIVISADRPHEWIDQDDSQTIRQPGALHNITKNWYDLDGENRSETYLWYANRILNEGLQLALKPKAGPVHFNIHLSGNTAHSSTDCEERKVRKVEVISPLPRLDKAEINRLAEMAVGKKILFVAGFLLPDKAMQKAVAILNSLPNVCVKAETVSNLHLPSDCYVIDRILFPAGDKEKEELRPDILITAGGALISRKLKEFLREFPPVEHWSLSCSDTLIDCFCALTSKIEASTAPFIQSFAKRLKRLSAASKTIPQYDEVWKKAAERFGTPPRNLPWCDYKALESVLNALPRNTNLFLSNGTSVRYGQIIPYPVSHATFSNRGVSGIEGSTSVAVGASMVYNGLTCLITGDMSFGYDLAGLASGLENERLRIVVLDNGGGDIFRFIPATRTLAIREHYLAAKRETEIGLLADAFQFIYYYADSEAALQNVLDEFFSPLPRPAILHIDTTGCKSNSELLTNILSNKL